MVILVLTHRPGRESKLHKNPLLVYIPTGDIFILEQGVKRVLVHRGNLDLAQGGKLNRIFHGWLEHPQFLDIEKFDFPHRDDWAIWNDIQIGRGVNGKWTYGISYSSSTGGYGSGISVWGKAFDSRKECLVFALKEMMEGHKDGKGDKYSVRVLRQVKDLLDEVMGRKVVQLSLF